MEQTIPFQIKYFFTWDIMEGFSLQHLLRFVDLDTSLCCKSAFHGLRIQCEKWSELDILLRENNIHEMFGFAHRNGSVKLAKYCLLGGIIDQSEMNWGLYCACMGGHKELVELMISKGASDWNFGLHGACEGGRKELAELMISKGAKCWDDGLLCACMEGYKELVELMIMKGATYWNLGLRGACTGGHKELVKLMISHGANSCSNCDKSMQSHLN
jgi:hypothetical protein